MTAPYDDERAFEAAHWAGLPTMPDDASPPGYEETFDDPQPGMYAAAVRDHDVPDDERVVDVDDEDEERER